MTLSITNAIYFLNYTALVIDNSPVNRSAMSFDSIGYREYITFGGMTELFTSNGISITMSDDLHYFNSRQLVWALQSSNGPIPSARAYHASAYSTYEQKLYTYGGVHFSDNYADPKIYMDLWSYWPYSNMWEVKSVVSLPGALYGAALFTVDDGIYIFGGISINNGNSVYSNNMFKYNITTNTWSNIFSQNSLYPKARANHQYWSEICSISKNLDSTCKSSRLYINGGQGPKDSPTGRIEDTFSKTSGSMILDDTWYFDIYSSSWIKVNTHANMKGRMDSVVLQIIPGIVIEQGGQANSSGRIFDEIREDHLNERYSALSDTWSYLESFSNWIPVKTEGNVMPLMRHSGACDSMWEECFVVSGFNYVYSNNIGQIFNPYTYRLTVSQF